MNDREKQWRPSMNNKHKRKFYIILNINYVSQKKKKEKKEEEEEEKIV